MKRVFGKNVWFIKEIRVKLQCIYSNVSVHILHFSETVTLGNTKKKILDVICFYKGFFKMNRLPLKCKYITKNVLFLDKASLLFRIYSTDARNTTCKLGKHINSWCYIYHRRRERKIFRTLEVTMCPARKIKNSIAY